MGVQKEEPLKSMSLLWIIIQYQAFGRPSILGSEPWLHLHQAVQKDVEPTSRPSMPGEYCVDVLKGDASLVRTLWEDSRKQGQGTFSLVQVPPFKANVDSGSSGLKCEVQGTLGVPLRCGSTCFSILCKEQQTPRARGWTTVGLSPLKGN